MTYSVGMGLNPCPAIINAGTGATTYPGGYGDDGAGYLISAAAINNNGLLAGYGTNPLTLVQDAYGWNGKRSIEYPGLRREGDDRVVQSIPTATWSANLPTPITKSTPSTSLTPARHGVR